MKILRAKKHSALAQQFDDVVVRIEHIFAGQIRQTASSVSRP